MSNRAAQVTNYFRCREKVTEFNKATKLSKEYKFAGFLYRKLGDSLTFKAYADALFAKNDDLSSQVGYVILLCDTSGRSHILDYSSNKLKRFVRSIMRSEVYAFADTFDRSF